MDGSILWGILVLLLGTPIAIGIATFLAPFLFVVGIIALIIWGAASIFGFNVSFGDIWNNIWLVILILFLASIALWMTISLFKAVFKGKINWFRRHLNWTYVLACVVWFVFNMSSNETFDVVWWLSLIAAISWLVISGWVIKQKGQSLWWILLSWLWSPHQC
jgi:hypothetical protein